METFLAEQARQHATDSAGMLIGRFALSPADGLIVRNVIHVMSTPPRRTGATAARCRTDYPEPNWLDPTQRPPRNTLRHDEATARRIARQLTDHVGEQPALDFTEPVGRIPRHQGPGHGSGDHDGYGSPRTTTGESDPPERPHPSEAPDDG